MDCGRTFDPYVMDFDHVRGKKAFTIGLAREAVSIARLMEEVAKCDVVCSNCHRLRTKKRREHGE
jgi:hypothetical protein